MKKQLIISLLAMFGVNYLNAQTTLTTQLNAGVFSVTPVPATADFTKVITITLPAGVTNFVVNKKSTNISGAPAKQGDGSYTINVSKPKAASIDVVLSGTGIADFPLNIKNINGGGGDIKPKGSNSKAITLFSTFEEYKQPYRYDRKNNIAYFFFDQNGQLIGPAPVNVDADDYIDVYVAVPESAIADYSIQVTGEYSPSALEIRPHDAIQTGAAHGTDVDDKEKYLYIHQTFGPFTPEKAAIKIYGKNDDGETVIINQLDVKINKLYNVGIGASFVSTSLANPDFDVVPITGSSNNTIQKINDGKRSMITFNVIYYWKPTVDWVTGKLKNSSHITRGRDILKEPTFWERLNPTFGVALSDKWDQNLFLGGNFEFARGGSISAGWHYGKVQSLLNENFKLGSDVFTGTKDDIKLTNSWKWNGFIAITVDTRIFNVLFSHN